MTTCRTLVPLLVAGAFDGNSALTAGITVHDARDRDVRIENPGASSPPAAPSPKTARRVHDQGGADDRTQLRELRGKVAKPVRVMFVMSLLNSRRRRYRRFDRRGAIA